MSIFTKPLSQLGTADLQELLNDGAVENLRLEFKLQVPNKEDTLKKLSSFANTYGGFMVIGARADSTDGRIQDLPGVDVEAGYKQKVVQWCFDGASPPLIVQVSDPILLPAGNAKVCYVVYAAESDIAPHFLNGRKGIWVRTDEFSARFETHLADESELRHLLDRRNVVLDRRSQLLNRARKRFDTYVAKKHTDLGGARTSVGPVLELSVVPRFPARQICRQEDLGSYIQGNCLSWRQVMFPDPGRAILCQHESAIVQDVTRRTSILEANVWGLLFYATQVETQHGGHVGVHPYELAGCVLIFIRHACKMLETMGYSGPILVEAGLHSILDVPWLQSLHGTILFTRSGSVLDDQVAFSVSTSTEELVEKPDGVAVDVLRDLLFSVSWPELVDTPQRLEDLVRKAYIFNFWPVPAALRI